MISEEQQDQAALYALDLLGAEELAAFERELAANAELRTLARELRDAAGALALSTRPTQPPAALKDRVMQQLDGRSSPSRTANVITPPASAFGRWIPWAIAAALLVFCGLLARERMKLEDRLAQERAAEPMLVALAPSADGPPKARAVVAWNPQRQTGTIKVANLPAAGRTKDYQLWAVDAAHKEPISAGILHVDEDGVGQIQFKPIEPAHQVKAFAISLEREGGAPKKEGPILLIGSS